MKKQKTNLAASIQARLLNVARSRHEDYNLLLIRYLNERVLHRLAHSPWGSHFVLKGATLFEVWSGERHRATRDLDLLGQGTPTLERLEEIFSEVLARPSAPDDGLDFESALTVARTGAARAYTGVRIEGRARLGRIPIKVTIDVGFGDAVTPGPIRCSLPTLLCEMPAVEVDAYPPETAVAEKLEAIVQLGMLNSRLKDFFDLFVLAKLFRFERSVLSRAIRATFDRRLTKLPTERPSSLTERFTAAPAKIRAWKAFVKRSGLDTAPDLHAVSERIWEFVGPVLTAIHAGDDEADGHWRPGGPWVSGG